MSFQILNKEGQAIGINVLDAEAAELWGKKVEPQWYADPEPPRRPDESSAQYYRRCGRGNWYDIIGYNIHEPKSDWTTGWNNIKASLWVVQATSMYEHLYDDKTYKDEESDKEYTQLDIVIMATKQYLKPYFDLIDHWEAKGYRPVQIKE